MFKTKYFSLEWRWLQISIVSVLWNPSRMSWVSLQTKHKSHSGYHPKANCKLPAYYLEPCLLHSSSLHSWGSILSLLISSGEVEYKGYKTKTVSFSGIPQQCFMPCIQLSLCRIMVMVNISVTPARMRTPSGNEFCFIYLHFPRVLYMSGVSRNLINICRVKWKTFIPFGDSQSLKLKHAQE